MEQVFREKKEGAKSLSNRSTHMTCKKKENVLRKKPLGEAFRGWRGRSVWGAKRHNSIEIRRDGCKRKVGSRVDRE